MKRTTRRTSPGHTDAVRLLEDAPRTPRLRAGLGALIGAFAMVASLLTAGAEPAAAAPAEAMGWVYASQPRTKSYTPSGYNSEGAQNKVERVSTGRYRVTFPGLDRIGQEAQVVAQGNGSAHCGLDAAADDDLGAHWGLDSVGPDLLVYVVCHAGTGTTLVDARFVVSVTGQNGASSLRGAGVFVDRTGTRVEGYDSGGGVHVERVARGTYVLTFFKQTSFNANVQVTSLSGSFGNFCTVESFGDVNQDATVRIKCWSVQWAADTPFSVRLTTPQPGNVAYAQTTANSSQWQGPTERAAGVQLSDVSGGRRTVTFPELRGRPAGLMVTPMTNAPVRCAIATWSVNPTRISTTCVRAQDRQPSSASVSVWARTPPPLPLFPPTNPPPKDPRYRWPSF